MSNIFEEEKFLLFMEKNGPKAEKSKNNYISWLRFVSENFHKIDSYLNASTINVDTLYHQIERARHTRDIYKTPKDVSNIRSALRKYRVFIEQME